MEAIMVFHFLCNLICVTIGCRRGADTRPAFANSTTYEPLFGPAYALTAFVGKS